MYLTPFNLNTYTSLIVTLRYVHSSYCRASFSPVFYSAVCMCKYHNYLYIASTVLTDAVPSDVTEEGDTSQDVLTSSPHTGKTICVDQLRAYIHHLQTSLNSFCIAILAIKN